MNELFNTTYHWQLEYVTAYAILQKEVAIPYSIINDLKEQVRKTKGDDNIAKIEMDFVRLSVMYMYVRTF